MSKYQGSKQWTLIHYLEELKKIVIKAEVLIREERIARTEQEVSEIELEQHDPMYEEEEESEEDTEPEELAPSLASGSSRLEDEKKPKTKKRKRNEEDVFWETKTPKKSRRDEGEPEKKAPSSSGKRSHHATRKCPVCKKENSDLRRHLESHVRKGVIKKESVGIILSVAVNKGKTRGHARSAGKDKKRKGLKLKWCPVKGCDTVTHLLRSHLQKYHRVKSGVSLEKYLNQAAEYKGKEEIDRLSTELARPSTSTSTAHPTKEESPCPPPLPSNSSSTVASPSPASPPLPASSPLPSEPSSCEEENHYSNRQAYYTEQHPRNDRHRWLVLFYQHLSLPDCGRKKNKNRLQHAEHVRKILNDLDPDGVSIDILSEDEGYIVWTQWVDPNLDYLRSGTIRSYLGSLESFLNFVTLERVRKGTVPEVHDDVLKICRNTIKRVKGWRKTVDLETRPQRTERLLDECDKILKTSDVQQFLDSKPIQLTKDVFTKVEDDQVITSAEMCQARDFLLCLTTIKTGTQPGALESATLKHYHSMKRDENTGKLVLLVPDHKRAVVGPALIGMDRELEVLFKTYVERIRPQFGDNSDHLFVTTEGVPFKKGTICRRMPQLWQRSSVRPDLRVTATNIRKWIVTECHNRKIKGAPFDEDIVRQGLCHSDKTAKSFYLRSDKTSVAAQSAEIIASCTIGKAAEASTSTCTSPKAPAIDEDVETPESEMPESQNPPSVDNPEKVTSELKRPLTEAEKSLIKAAFEDIIASSEIVTLKVVRARLQNHAQLSPLLEITGMDQTIADRVRRRQATAGKSPQKQTPLNTKYGATRAVAKTQTEEEDAERLQSDSSYRMEWSAADTNIIREHLSKEKSCPKKAFLQSFFHQTAELQDMLAKRGNGDVMTN